MDINLNQLLYDQSDHNSHKCFCKLWLHGFTIETFWRNIHPIVDAWTKLQWSSRCLNQISQDPSLWADSELIIRMIKSTPLDPNKSGIIVNVIEKWNHYVISRSQCCPAYPGLSGKTGEVSVGCCTFLCLCWFPQGFVPGINVLVLVHRYPELSVLAFEKSGT